MDGSFEVFQIAATNDHLLALLYNDEPEIEPEQTPQFVYWNVLENYHEMDWEDDEIVDDNINWDLENDALRAENNALIADLERRDAALKLLEANMISNKESYETMQDMLAGQLESALHDVDMMAETVQGKSQCKSDEHLPAALHAEGHPQDEQEIEVRRYHLVQVYLIQYIYLKKYE